MTDVLRTGSVAGQVAPGYEVVRDLFAHGVPLLGRRGGAFAVYVDGELVVDLWAGTAAPDEPWCEDTLAVIMSCTKGLAALCVQVLIDRGLLDLDEPVSRCWPEFAQNGKDAVTVRQVMAHTSGVLGIDGAADVIGFDPERWAQQDEIAAAFAASAPSWEPGTRHGYHALSFGWLVAEIVRRVDGRTIGCFFAEEVAGPLGLDARIGTPPSEQARVSRPLAIDTDALPPEVLALVEAQLQLARTDGTLCARAYLGGHGTSGLEHLIDLVGSPEGMAMEAAAANGTATARSLARMYAMLAAGGELDGVRIVTAESVALLGTQVLEATDEVLAELDLPGYEVVTRHPVARTPVYQANNPTVTGLPRFGPSRGAFGTEGFGGQVAFADPERRVAIAYVRSDCVIADLLAPQLIDAVYALVGAR